MLENKSHRTKAEIKYRKQAEQALYTGEHFKELPQVKNNKIAHAEFLRLKRLYEKISYVDALDQQIINRYCLEVANTYAIQQLLDKLENDLEEAEEFNDRLKLYEAINKTMSAGDKSKALLLKYEDRLFLNPTTRIKSIPKTPEKKEEKSGMAAYREKRAGNNGVQSG